jgi:hypothetical protein
MYLAGGLKEPVLSSNGPHSAVAAPLRQPPVRPAAAAATPPAAPASAAAAAAAAAVKSMRMRQIQPESPLPIYEPRPSKGSQFFWYITPNHDTLC